ncbi:MAG: cation-translocating P-type ATPase C-terminal domain-containing protein [Burkholderiaceae bacterium]
MIDAAMWWGVVQIGLVVAVVSLLTMDLYLPGGLIEGDGDLANARTAGFAVLVFAHLFNCFNARSETASAFSRPTTNPWLWGAVALSGVLQVGVVHLQILNTAFGTAPLTLGQWGVCAAMGSTALWQQASCANS